VCVMIHSTSAAAAREHVAGVVSGIAEDLWCWSHRHTSHDNPSRQIWLVCLVCCAVVSHLRYRHRCADEQTPTVSAHDVLCAVGVWVLDRMSQLLVRGAKHGHSDNIPSG
jgi:hypothetical protein